MAFTNARYEEAARVTLAAIDTYIGRPRLTPAGGLYTVMDVGRDADAFVPEALKATGVLVVPGRGFGPSIANGVRISYGPLVTTPDRITEGLQRLGAWMRRAARRRCDDMVYSAHAADVGLRVVLGPALATGDMRQRRRPGRRPFPRTSRRFSSRVHDVPSPWRGRAESLLG